jgi:sulfoxide reductase heme-binding subunit YedZ
MDDENRRRLIRGVMCVAALIQVVVVLASLLARRASAHYTVLRASALFGFVALFWAIVSSEYVREMRKLLGRPYLTVHHALTRVGWVLIMLHPLSYAVLLRNASVLVPVFSPLDAFLKWAGRPALYLFLVATLAAVLRSRSKRYWKYLHKLNYLGFLLVFVHSSLLGSDLKSTGLRVVWAAMAAVVLLIGLHKGTGRR